VFRNIDGHNYGGGINEGDGFSFEDGFPFNNGFSVTQARYGLAPLRRLLLHDPFFTEIVSIKGKHLAWCRVLDGTGLDYLNSYGCGCGCGAVPNVDRNTP
jgi:hypothetical protein